MESRCVAFCFRLSFGDHGKSRLGVGGAFFEGEWRDQRLQAEQVLLVHQDPFNYYGLWDDEYDLFAALLVP